MATIKPQNDVQTLDTVIRDLLHLKADDRLTWREISVSKVHIIAVI